MRNLDPATLAALSNPNVPRIAMVRMHLDSDVIAWHSGFGSLIFETYEYVGAGHLGSISNVTEASEAKPNKIKVGIAGIDPVVISALLGEETMGRKAYVHLAICDEDWQIVGEPILWFYGHMDPPSGRQGKTGSFEVAINSRLADWDRPLVERYSNVEQQARFPDDKGFEFAEQVAANGLVGAD